MPKPRLPLLAAATLLASTIASISLATPLAALANPTPIEHEWEEVHRDDMVTVYRKEVEGSDILALKGTGTLDAPMSKLWSVVMDAEHRSEWMEQVKEVEVVRQISPTDRIVYFHLSPPWPIQDRDLVVEEKFEVDRAAHKITMRFKSVEDASHPVRSDRVRAELYSGSFELASVDGGKRTEMTAESHADPKGSIPKFIVNLYQKSMPRKTLLKLLERSRDPAVTESAAARAAMAAN
jgi:hypothetical protein